MGNSKTSGEKSSSIFNQQFVFHAHVKQSAIIIPLVDWNFIKSKLINKSNYWFLLEKIGGPLLGIGIGKFYSSGWGSLDAWIFSLVSIIFMLISYIKRDKGLDGRCREAVEQMNMAEKRYGLEQADNTENINPNDKSNSNIEEIM